MTTHCCGESVSVFICVPYDVKDKPLVERGKIFLRITLPTHEEIDVNNRIALKIVAKYEDSPEVTAKAYTHDQLKKAHKVAGVPFKVRKKAKVVVASKKTSNTPTIKVSNWNEKTVSELRTAAKIAGMSGYSKMKKADLIGALDKMG
jgi:hypothetical protein